MPSPDPWVYCTVKAADADNNRTWLREQAGRVVREEPNGDIVLRFRSSELAHAQSSS